MRKQKSTLYLIAAALITLLAGACTDRSVPEPTPQEGVSLSFDQSEIEVDALGGEYSVYYTLTNGIDNINPVPQVNVSWIKDLRADDEMIYFTVEPNASAAARSTKIDLKYPGVEIPVLLTVNQPLPSEALFMINVKDMSISDCETIIIPKDPEMYYIAYGASVSYMRQEGIETAEQLFEDDYTYFKAIADQYGANLGQFLIYNNMAHQDTRELTFTGLSLNESFVIYVYGIEFTDDTKDYSLATPIYHVIVTPSMEDMMEVKFSMEYDINGPEVTHRITPIDWDGEFYYEYFAEGNQYFYPEEEEITDAYVASVISDWDMFVDIYMDFGYTASQFMDMACKSGTYEQSVTLLADTRYMAQAYAIEEVGGRPQVVSVPHITYFTTGNVDSSDMTIDIAIENVYARVGDISIIPSSQEEGYCVFIGTQDVIPTEGDIIEWILSKYSVSPIVGTYTEHMNSLIPETDYSILAFGYYGGKATTGLFRVDFTTTAAGTCENSVKQINVGAPYSAAELAEIDPETYAHVAMYDENGYYLMWAELIPENATPDLFYRQYDLTSVQQLGTDGIIADLLRYPSKPVQTLSFRNDLPFVICGVVMDQEGDISELMISEPYSFNLADKRPSEEFLAKIHSYDSYARTLSAKRESLVIDNHSEDNSNEFIGKAEALMGKSSVVAPRRLSVKM